MIWILIIVVTLVLMAMIGWGVVAVTKATWLFRYRGDYDRTCRRCGAKQVRVRDVEGDWQWLSTSRLKRRCECWAYLDIHNPCASAPNAGNCSPC